MKTLHPFILSALVAPILTLSGGAALAEKTAGQDARKGDQSAPLVGQSDSQKMGERQRAQDQARMKYKGHMASIPPNGMQASELIGATVKIGDDEDVGSVADLIIDENGQVAAIVVGVGGFLGMGEKTVAIGWGNITRSGSMGEQELHVDMTREQLRTAPGFEEPE